MRNADKDRKLLGLVLRRTNYGEADRILNLITPVGKISAMAKGVRRPKSKMAGGVEIFTLSEYNVHFGKDDFGVVTGVKMVKHFGGIIKDYGKMELGAMMLSKINTAAEGVDTAEYFELLKTSLTALDQNVASEIVEAWFIMNFKKLVGEEINLYLDKNNKKLQPQTNYLWDPSEMVFVKNDRGDYGENEIKIMRLMMSTRPEVVARVKNIDQNMGKILNFARSVI